MKKIFIVWKPGCTRSENIARPFGAEMVFITFFNHKRTTAAKLGRYILSFFATFKVLFRKKADIVFCINNPPFIALAIYLYTRLFRGQYILDSHSGPFNDKRLRWFLPVYRHISSRALLNINTNTTHQALVRSWGGRSKIIGDVPIDHERTYPEISVEERSVMVVCSFMFDEPVEEIISAARETMDIHYYFTGNYRDARQDIMNDLPPNVHFTGFLSLDEYFGLMQSVKAVMVLTTRDDTMQRGAYEALSLERPIITSDWMVLRDSFGEGAVYVKNTADSIAAGVRKILDEYEQFQCAVSRQRISRRKYFDRVVAEIDGLLVNNCP